RQARLPIEPADRHGDLFARIERVGRNGDCASRDSPPGFARDDDGTARAHDLRDTVRIERAALALLDPELDGKRPAIRQLNDVAASQILDALIHRVDVERPEDTLARRPPNPDAIELTGTDQRRALAIPVDAILLAGQVEDGVDRPEHQRSVRDAE